MDLPYQSIAYILIAVLFTLTVLLYFFRWRDLILPYLLGKRHCTSYSNETDYAKLPKLSVIVPFNNEIEILTEHLPLILDQNYPDFEVIVVDETPTSESKELLEQLKFEHRNLRSTFIPTTATDICKRKLSITLGIRAARSPWIVVTTASAAPQSRNWLIGLATRIDEDTDIVLGYANYIDEGSALTGRAIYERLWTQLRCFRSALGYGAIGGDESNFCIRKSAFFEANGYSDLLQVPFGESHQLIDLLSTPQNVRVAVTPDSIVREYLPILEIWQNMRVSYREILHHASQRTHFYMWREGLGSMLNYLFLVLVLAYIGCRIAVLSLDSSSFWTDYVGDFLVFCNLCVFLVCPLLLFHKTTKFLGERDYSRHLLHYQLTQPFVHLSLKIKRWRLRKNFI